MYILCHTSDFAPVSYVEWFIKNFSDSIGQFKKISVACCRTALDLKNGKLKLFCDELTKENKIALPDGLKVCGFAIALTTFDLDKDGFIAQKYTADNPELFSDAQTRLVGSVRQDGMKLTFLHEKIPTNGAQQFIKDIEKMFSDKIEAMWVTERFNYIPNKVNTSLKPSRRIANETISTITWEVFCKAYPDKARAFVNNDVWEKFAKDVSSVSEKSAKMWDSLVKYIEMKKAFKFTNGRFVMIELSEYTDQPDMKLALSFVMDAQKRRGKLAFVPA